MDGPLVAGAGRAAPPVRPRRTPRLVTLARLFVALMLASTVGSAALSLWSTHRAESQLHRLGLVRDSHEAWLRLSADTYRLFKLYGGALLLDDAREADPVGPLVADIRVQLDARRALLGRASAGVADAETDALDGLERTIEELVAAFGRQLSGDVRPAPASGWSTLSTILDEGIAGEFRARIETTLAAERASIAEAEREAARQSSIARSAAMSALYAALLLGAGTLLVFERRVREPLERLRAGIARIERGDFDAPVSLPADDELGRVAATLNAMAASIAGTTRSLVRHGEQLEAIVRERTEQLEGSLRDAREADARRRRMLADVGHELRTPLTVIRGEADIALRGASTDPALYRASLERVREAAAHTATLVDDLLFVARNERGEARLRLEPVDLAALLRDTLDTFAGDATLCPTPEAAPLEADAGRLRQAILVLVDNARRHGSADDAGAAPGEAGEAGGGDAPEVRLERDAQGYRISVRDRGPGMSAADREAAFRRFYRGSNAAERYGDGLGLGLPVALSIAEAHGGTIELADAPGGGLLATLVLPGPEA